MKAASTFGRALDCRYLIVLTVLIVSSIPAGAECVPSPSGLVGWWAGEGTPNDQTSINHGVLQNGVTYASGKAGVGFNFDGVDDYVVVQASASLDVGTGEGLTIEGWVNPGDLTRSQAMVEWNDNAGNIGVHLWHSDAGIGGLGSILMDFSDTVGASHILVSSPNLLMPGVFQHVSGTYNKSTGIAKIFRNGSPVASANLGSFTPQTSYPLYFGTRVSGPAAVGGYYAGVMDEVSIYNRALTDLEIQAIFNAGTAGKCRSMLAPLIVGEPANQTVVAGGNASFHAVVAGDLLTYQWRFQGTNINGAVTNPLVLTNVSLDQAGNYSLFVSNALDTATSSDAILTVNPAPPCSTLPTGVVSWWKGEGNSIDTFGPNDGTNVGNVSHAFSQVGQGFSFDGNGDAVRLANTAGLQLQTFTIEAWIRRSSPTASSLVAPDAELLCYGQNGFGFGMWNDGRLLLTKVGVSSILSTFAVNDTNFHHVAVTKSGSTVIFYIDGIGEIGPTYNPTFTFSTPLAIGARGDNLNNSFYGQIDELAVYNRALGPTEIQALFAASVSGKCVPNLPPAISIHPTSQSVRAGTNVTLSATATGIRPLFYQWFKDGLKLTGATSPSLVLSNVQPGNAGIYALQATNAFGNTLSSNAHLKVVVVSAYGNGQPLTNATHSFSNVVNIELQNAYTNGLIFYTLDGSPPTFASSQYAGSFVISNSVILRALGYSADFFQSGYLDPIVILLPPSYPLTASSAGGGSVTLNPPGGFYLSNTVITVTAIPGAGWTFLQWLGDLSGTSATTNLLLTRPKTVQAVFGTSLSTTAAGGGSVVLNPLGGIYPFGATVQLAGIPNAGNQFALWGNAAGGNVNPLSFMVTNANPTVSSLFVTVGAGQAALTVVPVGLGRVNVSPRANAYALGTGVTITATPDAGQSFLGWSGDASGDQNPLLATLNQNTLIYANFTAKPRLHGEPLGGEGFRLTLTGDYPVSYQLESSADVAAWGLLTTLTNTSGSVQFLDTTMTNVQFYRACKSP